MIARFAVVLIAAAIIATILTAFRDPGARDTVATDHLEVRVVASRIVGPGGEPIVLRGVNRMGFEYSCVQGKGLLDAPLDQASVDAITAWGANAVRLPLNEHCWLGIAGSPSGADYQNGVVDYVHRLVSSGLYVVLDLHWSAPGAGMATEQQAMPNTDHSAEFWASVARRFRDEGRVIFDLFNEPVPNSNQRDTSDDAARRSWQCWRDGAAGGSCDVLQLHGMRGDKVAGMQSLVDAVRATGATNLILVAGIQWGNTLWSSAARNWLAYAPVDPLRNIAASWHAYDRTWCSAVPCYESEVAMVAARVPVVATEFGDDTCDATWRGTLLDWLERKQIGYLAWVWNTWTADDCSAKRLITDYDGRPSTYGQFYRDWLRRISQ